MKLGKWSYASTEAMRTSPGKSRKTGPGLPESEALTAF